MKCLYSKSWLLFLCSIAYSMEQPSENNNIKEQHDDTNQCIISRSSLSSEEAKKRGASSLVLGKIKDLVVHGRLEHNLLEDHEVARQIHVVIDDLIERKLDPDIQDLDRKTILHYLTETVTEASYEDRMLAIKKLLEYEADPHILDDNMESAYDIAQKTELTGKWYKQWAPVEGRDESWQENHDYVLPNIRRRYRYSKGGDFENDKKSDNRILFCILHGTGFGPRTGTGPHNEDYFDLKSKGFSGFLQLAQEYTDHYNDKRRRNNKPEKVLHLVSFVWSGQLLDDLRKAAAEQFVTFLNGRAYRNALYCFVSHSHACNVINHALRILVNLQKDKLFAKNINVHRYNAKIGKRKEKMENISTQLEVLNNTLGGSAQDTIGLTPEGLKKLIEMGVIISDDIRNKITKEYQEKQNKAILEDKKKELEKKIIEKLYKGIARLLIYLAPPVRQKYTKFDKRNRFLSGLFLENQYNTVNEKRMIEEPTSYDQLYVLYSEGDWIAKLGAVDHEMISAMFATTMASGTISAFLNGAVLASAPMANLIVLSPVLYTGITNLLAFKKNVKYAHTYLDILPKNEFTGNTHMVQGPKVHIKVHVDGKEIGHSSTSLIENLPYVWKMINYKYPLHAVRSSYFNLNINTDVHKNEKYINNEININFMQLYLKDNEKIMNLFQTSEWNARRAQIEESAYVKNVKGDQAIEKKISADHEKEGSEFITLAKKKQAKEIEQREKVILKLENCV